MVKQNKGLISALWWLVKCKYAAKMYVYTQPVNSSYVDLIWSVFICCFFGWKVGNSRKTDDFFWSLELLLSVTKFWDAGTFHHHDIILQFRLIFFSFLSWFSVNPQVQTPGESSGWGQQSRSRTRDSKQLAGEKTGNISQNLFRFLYYIFSLVACFNQPLLCLFVCNDLRYYYLQKYDKYDTQLSSFKSLKFFQSWISMWLSIVRQNGRSDTPQLVLPWSLCSSD